MTAVLDTALVRSLLAVFEAGGALLAAEWRGGEALKLACDYPALFDCAVFAAEEATVCIIDEAAARQLRAALRAGHLRRRLTGDHLGAFLTRLLKASTALDLAPADESSVAALGAGSDVIDEAAAEAECALRLADPCWGLCGFAGALYLAGPAARALEQWLIATR